MTGDPHRLDSWKEIAAYLGRDMTTAIRWEKARGLPVHRVPGGKLSRVFVYTKELDEWLQQPPEPPPVFEPAEAPVSTLDAPSPPGRSLGPTVIVSGSMVALACALAFAAWDSGRVAVTFSMAGHALTGTDISGRVVWSHAFADTGATAAPRTWSFAGPIDSDGRPDLLAVIDVKRDPALAPVSTLHRFSESGRLLWSHAPSDRYAFRAGEYGPPWASWHVAPYRAGAESRVAWSVHHYTWWPSLLLSFDAAGRRTGTFVNSGWIGRAEGIPGGNYLAVAGMSNVHQAYFLAILDARRPSGSSPEYLADETVCLSCPPGKPLHYFVFPRSDVARTFVYPADPPDITVFDNGTLRVQVMETPGPDMAATVYEFDASFRLRDIRTSDAFDAWHGRLEASGTLRHAAAMCPDRRARGVRRWTPASGWIE